MESISDHIGRKLRTLRLIKGYTQADFGKIIDVSFQQIQKYERGSNYISAENLYLISRKFQVPINYFFEGMDCYNNAEADLKQPSDVRTSAALRRLLAIQETKRGRNILKLLNAVLEATEK